LQSIRRAASEVTTAVVDSVNEARGLQVTKEPAEVKAMLARMMTTRSNFEHLISCFNTLFPAANHGTTSMIASNPTNAAGFFPLAPAIDFLKQIQECDNLSITYRDAAKTMDGLCNRQNQLKADPKSSPDILLLSENSVASATKIYEDLRAVLTEKCSAVEDTRDEQHKACLDMMASMLAQKRSFWAISAVPMNGPDKSPSSANKGEGSPLNNEANNDSGARLDSEAMNKSESDNNSSSVVAEDMKNVVKGTGL